MEFLVTVPLLIIDDLGMRKLPLIAAEELLEIIGPRSWRTETDMAPQEAAGEHLRVFARQDPQVTRGVTIWTLEVRGPAKTRAFRKKSEAVER